MFPCCSSCVCVYVFSTGSLAKLRTHRAWWLRLRTSEVFLALPFIALNLAVGVSPISLTTMYARMCVVCILYACKSIDTTKCNAFKCIQIVACTNKADEQNTQQEIKLKNQAQHFLSLSVLSVSIYLSFACSSIQQFQDVC